MKKIVLSLVLAVIASVGFSQTGKIGFVDVEGVIARMPEYTAAQNSLNTFAETLVPQNIKTKAAQLDEKYKKYQAEEATMGEARKEVAQQEMIALEKELNQLHQQNQTQQKLAQKQIELFTPVEQKAGQIIEQVAKENGYTVVFDAAQMPLLYADPSANMMPLIMKKLGVEGQQ